MWNKLAALGVDVGRTKKPREHGLTIALDVGLGSRGAADLVEVCADHVDFVKIAWGSSIITGGLEKKLESYRAGGLLPMFGGTIFEYAFLHGRVEQLLDFIRDSKIHIELSDGSLDIPHHE